MFANSVLGARSTKYADYLDVCAAIVGRAPAAGPHLDSERAARMVLDATALAREYAPVCGDAFWPCLGYLAGLRSQARVPVLVGLAELEPTRDDLKAFSAAFGTTGTVALFHMAGVTPEAPDVATALGVAGARAEAEVEAEAVVELSKREFEAAWCQLDGGSGDAGRGAGGSASTRVDCVALGNPHLSLEECATLVALCSDGGGPKHPDVVVMATLGREIYSQAEAAGYVELLQSFGVEFVTDTCWCMLTEPVVPPTSKTLLTNSGKYAHYGPGLVDREVRFNTTAACMEAARTGWTSRPGWLTQAQAASPERAAVHAP